MQWTTSFPPFHPKVILFRPNLNFIKLATFRPIVSAVGTPNHKLAKFLLHFLTPSTANEYTMIHSFHFAEGICQHNPDWHMASLDVDFLFTNILLHEIIDICIDNLYNGNQNPSNIPKHDFSNLFNTATKESFFMFTNKYYKRANGAAMGSLLGPALAYIFALVYVSFWKYLASRLP